MKETSGVTVILGVFLIMALFLSAGLGFGLVRSLLANDSGNSRLTAGLLTGLLAESFNSPQGCPEGQYSRWSGNSWSCGVDRVGGGGDRGPQGIQGPQGPQGPAGGGGFFGGSNTYNAGEGLRLSGSTFSLEGLRSCSSGEYSRWNGSSWGCYEDRGTSSGGGSRDDVDAGRGLRFSGDSLEIDSPSCSSGQYSRWNGSNWVCETDRTTGGGTGGGNTYYAGTGLNLNGDTFSLAIQSCSSGSFNRWTGSSWVCETDRTSGGGGGTGERGPAGPQGPQGERGSVGPQGPAGTGSGGTPNCRVCVRVSSTNGGPTCAESGARSGTWQCTPYGGSSDPSPWSHDSNSGGSDPGDIECVQVRFECR